MHSTKPLEPKVSIVIPVYNGSNYMRQAIDSALGQTYKNIEVLVVNDGSTDDGQTEQIALSYGNRIRYLAKENGGVASALNLGIRNMTGEWFVWLSHDDMLSSNRIEQDFIFINSHPGVLITFSRLEIINAQGNVLSERKYTLQKATNPKEVLQLTGINFCSITMHRSCLEKVGLFNEANRTTQDTEMVLSLSKYYTFWFNDQSLTYSREHAEKGTHTASAQHKKDRLMLADFIRKNFTFDDFFPGLDKNDRQETDAAWEYFENLYRFLGATEYALESYRQTSAGYRTKRLIRRTLSRIKRLLKNQGSTE